MTIKEINKLISEVKPYDKGSHMMWTDPYISGNLLEAHINPEEEAASRKPESISATLEWMETQVPAGTKRILDLGCGPGLYAVELARMGYDVTGYDFSQNSINYANNQAMKEKLTIRYECMNYLDMTAENEFDTIIMIYCDFGVLSVTEQKQLINNIHRALKPGGMFIFDALNDRAISKLAPYKTWDVSAGGFWHSEPYACLSERLHFPEKNALLDQHTVIRESGECRLYRFWNHLYTLEDVKDLFASNGFGQIEEHSNILPDDDGVTFYTMVK